MRIIKNIFLLMCLVVSTASSATVLLEHFDQKGGWDAFTLNGYYRSQGVITAGIYAWGFFDDNTTAFFDGKNWQPGFTPPGEIDDIKAGFPMTGEQPIAWMRVGSSIYYFNGNEWKLCEAGPDEAVEIATSGGNVWVLAKNNWLGMANKSNPTHFHYVKLAGTPVENLKNFSPDNIRVMTANNDAHPYMFMVLQSDNHDAALYRFDTTGNMVKVHEIITKNKKSPNFNLQEYNDDLILADDDRYYAYSSDFGDHWIINKGNVTVTNHFQMYSKMLCIFAIGPHSGVQCFDASQAHSKPLVYGMPDIDPQEQMFTTNEMGGWYSVNRSFTDNAPHFYRIDPSQNQLIDSKIADEFAEIPMMFSQSRMSNGRLAVCGKDHSGNTIIGLYDNQKWQVTPISAPSCDFPSMTSSRGYYTGNGNVWFTFSYLAGSKKSSHMKFLHRD